jgi:hypothetical protein
MTRVRYISPALAAVAFFIVAFQPINDFDFFWHVAMGREILNTGKVIESEIFSYTASGNPFSNHMFLSEIFFWLVYSKFGALPLVVFKAMLMAALGLVLYRSSRFLGADPATASAIVVFAAIAERYRLQMRPLVFSLFFLGLLGYVLFG